MVTSCEPGVPRSEKFWKYVTRGFVKVLEMYVSSNFEKEALFLKILWYQITKLHSIIIVHPERVYLPWYRVEYFDFFAQQNNQNYILYVLMYCCLCNGKRKYLTEW